MKKIEAAATIPNLLANQIELFLKENMRILGVYIG